MDMDLEWDRGHIEPVAILELLLIGYGRVIDECPIGTPEVADANRVLSMIKQQFTMATADIFIDDLQVAITAAADDVFRVTNRDFGSFDDKLLALTVIEAFENDLHGSTSLASVENAHNRLVFIDNLCISDAKLAGHPEFYARVSWPLL